MSTRPSTTLGLASAALLALSLVACGDDGGTSAAADGTSTTDASSGVPAPELPDTITIGYQLIPNGDLIVKHEGWLEEAFGDDVEVEWQLFDSGGAVNEAFIAGGIDIGLAGSSPVSRGISNGIEYQVPWIHDVIGDAEALVVRDDLGVADVAGLEGLTIATPFASTAHYSLLAALQDAGLDPADVDI